MAGFSSLLTSPNRFKGTTYATNNNIVNNSNNTLKQTALDLAKSQLENSRQQSEWSFGYRAKEADQQARFQKQSQDSNQGFELQKQGSDQTFQRQSQDSNQNFQRQSQDSSQGFQRQSQDSSQGFQLLTQGNQYGQERTMFNMQDAAQSRNTQSARQAANALYFGRARNRRGFQGRS